MKKYIVADSSFASGIFATSKGNSQGETLTKSKQIILKY